MFVTTHYMDEAEYCHRVGIMKLGRLVEVENPQTLKQRHRAASMQEVFLRIVRGESS